MPELDRKATRIFTGKVVRKDLVRKVKVGANVPVFVLEYLLGKYCATDDATAIEAGLRVVYTTISSNFVRPDEANKAQSMVKDKGKHTLIDKVKVRYLSDDDKHWAELVNFGHKYVQVPEHFLREYDRLLMGVFGLRLISGISTMRTPGVNGVHSGSIVLSPSRSQLLTWRSSGSAVGTSLLMSGLTFCCALSALSRRTSTGG
jgi:predicted ATP-dependent Lon-type protease